MHWEKAQHTTTVMKARIAIRLYISLPLACLSSDMRKAMGAVRAARIDSSSRWFLGRLVRLEGALLEVGSCNLRTKMGLCAN